MQQEREKGKEIKPATRLLLITTLAASAGLAGLGYVALRYLENLQQKIIKMEQRIIENNNTLATIEAVANQNEKDLEPLEKYLKQIEDEISVMETAVPSSTQTP